MNKEKQDSIKYGNQGLLKDLIEVIDNGPRIAENKIATVLARGGRLDDQTSGHGLGLAMVESIVELYKGAMEIGRSRLGGASIKLWLPWN